MRDAAFLAAAPAPATRSSTAGLWIASVSGLLVLTMGLVALAGWILGHPRLVQWQPSLPPLFYTTALALALAGGAQLLIAGGSRIVAIVLVALVVVLAAGTLSWPTPGGLSATLHPWVEPWVERLLVTTTVRDARPMRVPAAVGLLLVGGGLLIHAKRRQSLFCLTAARSIGAAVVFMGLAAIVSRAIGAGSPPLSGAIPGAVPGAIAGGAPGAILGAIPGAIDMPPQIAAALILLGLGVVALPSRVAAIAGPGGASCLPAIAGVACLLATLTLWQTAHRQQEAHIADELRESAASAQARTVLQFDSDRRQLAYIARQMAIVPEEWPPNGPETWPASGLEHWLLASEPYLIGQSSHRAALWIDEELRVAGVNGGDDLLLHGVDLGASAARAAELREAMDAGDEVVMRADDLLHGRPTLLLAEPVRATGGSVGFAAGLVDLDAMFRLILHDEETRGFDFIVSDPAGTLYRTGARIDRPAIGRTDARAAGRAGGPAGLDRTQTAGTGTPPATAQGPVHRVPLTLASVGVQLQVTPSSRLIARDLGPVSHWALAFGLLVTALLTITVYMAQVARRRAASHERLNIALEEQMAHRHDVERELQRATADLQQSNRELEQTTTELQRSNRELEQFAAVASHDLRAPLQKVRGFADLLDQEYGPRLGDEGRDFLHRLKRSVTRMEGLVDDLLTLARVRAEGRAFTQVDLTLVLRDVLSDLDATLQDTGGRVEVGVLPAIDADATQMHQLLQNLMANGLKFRRDDEPPLVRVSARILEQGAAPECELCVADNGIGFDERHAERIFKPFERLHGPQHYEGSGIGLAVCARIAERHGGTISAASAPGRGAVFTVRLPVHHVHVTSAH